jgi:hypothetical protein
VLLTIRQRQDTRLSTGDTKPVDHPGWSWEQKTTVSASSALDAVWLYTSKEHNVVAELPQMPVFECHCDQYATCAMQAVVSMVRPDVSVVNWAYRSTERPGASQSFPAFNCKCGASCGDINRTLKGFCQHLLCLPIRSTPDPSSRHFAPPALRSAEAHSIRDTYTYARLIHVSLM